MCDLIKVTGLILPVSFWLWSNLHFVFGDRPHCKGDALKPGDFSKDDEVGFVRDLLVDVLARNLINLFDCEVPSVCEDLAKTRTSTCVGKCFKWKRDSCWSGSASRKVMSKAEALVEHLNVVVWEENSLKNIKEEEFMFKNIENVKTRLVKSGAADDDSKILGQLDTMKKRFCANYLHKESASIRRKNAEKLLQHDDVKNTIEQFIKFIEAKEKVKITNYHLEVDAVKAGDNLESGVIYLKFEYGDSKSTGPHSVILKIPSLSYPAFDALKRTNMFGREVHFYVTVLPELYRIGECEPFAPTFHMATSTGALVLQDLTVEGYRTVDTLKQLNFCEAEITLNVLATYHAAGYKYLNTLHKDDPSMSLIGSDQPEIKVWIGRTKKETFASFIQLVRSSSSITKTLLERILRLEKEILADPVIKENSLIVIMHNDCRANNILFKYNSRGKPSEAKLIDWQSSRIGIPILDLIYFFVTCVHIDVFENNDNSLFNQYIHTLSNKLNLDISGTSTLFDDLYNDLEHYKYYFMNVISTYWQGIMIVGASEDSSKVYQIRAVKWLLYLDRKGFI